MLPKLYSTIEEIHFHDPSLFSVAAAESSAAASPVSSKLKIEDHASMPSPSSSPPECLHKDSSIGTAQEQQQKNESLSSLPHLFLHFDINETILVGDVAGNDTVEECLNKIIAKVAFVSTAKTTTTTTTTNCVDGPQDGYGRVDDSRACNNFKKFVPKRWWDGSELSSPCTIKSTTTANIKINECNHHCNLDRASLAPSQPPPPPPPPPSPLYTGWTNPVNTCSYYKTKYKRHAKEFTMYHPQYRPMYEFLQSNLMLDCVQEEVKGSSTGDEVEEDDHDDDNMFQHFIPAFFHTLMYYFPSTKTATSTTADIVVSRNNNSNDNHNTLSGIEYDCITRRLPRPTKTTLVLRTFGTDLHRVTRAISEFAKGNHPHFPEYYNPNLILADEDELFCGGWRRRRSGVHNHRGLGDDTDGDEKDELIYELHPMVSSSCSREQHFCYSGDDEILNYLQSKHFVGIQDNYSFWDAHDCAPWAGKPIWARKVMKMPGKRAHDDNHLHQFNHHHILLDDNIHNDPNDGAGGIRIPVLADVDGDDDDDATPTTTLSAKTRATMTKYTSLHGSEALEMHGRHLIRVPTVRPILEPDWFIRQIEDARWRIYVEEEGKKDDHDYCGEEGSSKENKVK